MNDVSSQTARLHVLHVISGLLHGGAETVLQRLVTADRDRVRHQVVSMRGFGVIGPSLQAAGIEVIDLEMRGVAGSLRGLWRLYRLLRRQRPDVVQTWMYHADLLGGLIARLAGVRAVSWGLRNSGEHLAESSRSSRRAAWWCARVSGMVPAAIVACAHRAAVVHRALGYRTDRLVVIPNGYDLRRWQPDPVSRGRLRASLGVAEDEVLLGCVARWNPLKDHANLLAALALCQHHGLRLRCVLVGLGMSPDNAGLLAMARDLGVLQQLVLLGRRDDVPHWMAAIDVHVLASKAEGFPNVVCEAMACGAAAVVTDVGDAAEIVAQHGWVVAAQDPAALAQAMQAAVRAVRAPGWAARQTAARESVAQRYGLQAMVDRYDALWRRLAQNPLARGRSGWREADAQAADHGAYPVPGAPFAPRLLFFITNPAFFISHRLPVAEAARQAGYEVHVASMAGPEGARLKALGFVHHVLPLSRTGMRPWAEWRSLWALGRLLRTLQPALVHAVTLKSVLYGGIMSRLMGVPAFVAAISGLGYVFIPGPGWRRGWQRHLALVLYRLALGHRHSRVIFQNPADRDVLLRAGALRAAQVVMMRGSGVDLQAFRPRPWPAQPVTAVMAARLLRDKGVVEFAEAARILRQQGSPVRCRLAGSPDPENPASIDASTLQGWQDDGWLDYVGECTDVAALYAQAHIVVLPSYREGLPKSLIEAAAAGRPVVTTDVPGCRDAIEPGVSGLLVPARDASALAGALHRLAGDAALRVRMGAAGRALAERDFGLERIVQAHLAVYADLGVVPVQKGSACPAGSTAPRAARNSD